MGPSTNAARKLRRAGTSDKDIEAGDWACRIMFMLKIRHAIVDGTAETRPRGISSGSLAWAGCGARRERRTGILVRICHCENGNWRQCDKKIALEGMKLGGGRKVRLELVLTRAAASARAVMLPPNSPVSIWPRKQRETRLMVSYIERARKVRVNAGFCPKRRARTLPPESLSWPTTLRLARTVVSRRRSQIASGSRAKIAGSFIEPYRWLPSILKVLTIIRPETLVRWHRAAFAATGAGSRAQRGVEGNAKAWKDIMGQRMPADRCRLVPKIAWRRFVDIVRTGK
jgi:hypothetical protein